MRVSEFKSLKEKGDRWATFLFICVFWNRLRKRNLRYGYRLHCNCLRRNGCCYR